LSKGWQRATVAGALVAVALLAGLLLFSRESTAQTPTIIGVDADPRGNSPTSLGTIESCVSVATGDTFEVDVFIMDVTDLLAWEAYFVYDNTIVSVVDHDLQMFQAANDGSNVFDVSENLPDLDGQYRLSGADIGDPPAPDSGSGVLASITLKAVGPGISPARLASVDVNGDGTIDLGTFLRDVAGNPISDADGDGVFDGQSFDAEIAVDTACPPDAVVLPARPGSATASPRPSASPTVSAQPTSTVASPTPTPTPAKENDEGSSWTSSTWIAGYVVAGLAILLAGAALLVLIRRRAR
jgi:hypothetical protein